jgi:hypothetical protein
MGRKLGRKSTIWGIRAGVSTSSARSRTRTRTEGGGPEEPDSESESYRSSKWTMLMRA